MISLLSRWARSRQATSATHLTFTVYSRAGCGCCHKALDVLNALQPKHGFRVEEVDVDADPALAETFGLSVPVVAVNGKVRFKGVVNPVLLERLLEAESRGR